MSRREGVAAIVLDYRGAERTITCLESLRDQGLSKVLLVDNSDDRASSEMLDRLLEEHCFPEGWIELIRPDRNLGFANGVNYAIGADRALGGHAYYLLMNNDAVAPDGLLCGLQRVLSESDRLGAVAPMLESGAGKLSPVIWYNRYLALLTPFSTPLSFPYLCGCCVLLKASIIEGSELFNPAFFMYGEDVELGWRLWNRCVSVAAVDKVSVAHEQGASSRKGQLFYEMSLAKTHLQLTSYTGGRAVMPLMFVSKSVALFCRAVIRSLRYGNMTPMIALLEGFRSLGKGGSKKRSSDTNGAPC